MVLLTIYRSPLICSSIDPLLLATSMLNGTLSVNGMGDAGMDITHGLMHPH